MSDRRNDTVAILITFELAEMCRAARLGGLPIALDEYPLDDTNGSMELLKFFVKRGIRAAIDDSFDRHYPPHYPEDDNGEYWQGNASASRIFGHIGGGVSKW